jgi:Nucleotidyl transferase AbiEii toxin, Type IV TA system
MKYTSAAAFRQALEQRLKNEATATGLGLARLRKRVAFELFLRRLLIVAPDRWVLKGALALDFRLAATTRSTKDIDLGRDDDETAAIRDITAIQQLAMDDFFTFAATRTDELDDTDEFSAVRFHVTAQLAGRTFEQFLVDIGFSDTISWTPDTIHTSDLLSFAGIEPIALPAIPIPQHLAEKAHAYTPHLRRIQTAQHPPEGPRRHPADREFDNDRRRPLEARAGEHLRRTRTAAPPNQPPVAPGHLGRPLQTPGRHRPRRERPHQRLRQRRRLPRSHTRRAHRWTMGPQAPGMGRTSRVT